MQLKVVKTDGSIEYYMYTKVLRTLCNCMTACRDGDMFAAEQLTEAITYYLYNINNEMIITSNEILTMIKGALSETGFEVAATVLDEHYYQRLLMRKRLEVVDIDLADIADAKMFCQIRQIGMSNLWDKANITEWLICKFNIDRPEARTIAGIVEEKIFNMHISSITTGMIKQFALAEAAVFIQAAEELDGVMTSAIDEPAEIPYESEKDIYAFV